MRSILLITNESWIKLNESRVYPAGSQRILVAKVSKARSIDQTVTKPGRERVSIVSVPGTITFATCATSLAIIQSPRITIRNRRKCNYMGHAVAFQKSTSRSIDTAFYLPGDNRIAEPKVA